MTKHAFLVGVSDDKGYGFAIAKSLIDAGVSVSLGVWPPHYARFIQCLERGDFCLERSCFGEIYPLDVLYDTESDVPLEVRRHKRYSLYPRFSIEEVCSLVKDNLQGEKLSYLVHCVGASPNVNADLLHTSRDEYLQAVSSSSYSFVSLARFFSALMGPGGAFLNLSFMASQCVVPGYGGGMSSAKSALECDTRVLAYELGKRGIRVNSITAGPLRSRSAKAIHQFDSMASFARSASPLQRDCVASDVGDVASFLLSERARAITGAVIPVDNGLSIMGIRVSDSALLPEHQ